MVRSLLILLIILFIVGCKTNVGESPTVIEYDDIDFTLEYINLIRVDYGK